MRIQEAIAEVRRRCGSSQVKAGSLGPVNLDAYRFFAEDLLRNDWEDAVTANIAEWIGRRLLRREGEK
jgi:hypothetical protein